MNMVPLFHEDIKRDTVRSIERGDERERECVCVCEREREREEYIHSETQL